jgi:hypothetical protein
MSSWSTIHDHLLLPVTNTPLPAKISDLWLQGTTDWNQELLSTTFSHQVVQQIINTPIVQSPQNDILRWKPAPNGHCTSKSIYKSLQLQQTHSLPTTGSRAISTHTEIILKKIWKAKTMPPCLKPLPGDFSDMSFPRLIELAVLLHTYTNIALPVEL